MSALPFRVEPYSPDTLREFIKLRSSATVERIQGALHDLVFVDYLDAMSVVTVVLEPDYIDRDYLTDYSTLYARCFKDYGKFCSRIHFFSSTFSADDFYLALTGETGVTGSLKEGYVGFLVVRPLPRCFIGRTCLKPYSDDSRRKFPCTFDVPVSLYGIDLTVRTVPFQSQDRGTSACATTALWSSFQCAARKYNRLLQAPSEITRVAQSGIIAASRAIPSTGLTITQMTRACEAIALEAEVFSTTDTFILKFLIRAYLSLGVPAILGIHFENSAGEDAAHAVALTGYKFEDYESDETTLQAKSGLLCENVTKLYAHDDQVGPFARMSILSDSGSCTLSTSWEDRSGNRGDAGQARAKPWLLLIPVHPDVRLRATDIFDLGLDSLGGILRTLLSETENFDEHPLACDLVLTTSSRLKRDWIGTTHISDKIKPNLAVTLLPRFLWRIQVIDTDGPIMEFLFDATDTTPNVSEPFLTSVLQPMKFRTLGEAMLKLEDSIRGISRILDYLLDYFISISTS